MSATSLRNFTRGTSAAQQCLNINSILNSMSHLTDKTAFVRLLFLLSSHVIFFLPQHPPMIDPPVLREKWQKKVERKRRLIPKVTIVNIVFDWKKFHTHIYASANPSLCTFFVLLFLRQRLTHT